jgi:hypothetical protein
VLDKSPEKEEKSSLCTQSRQQHIRQTEKKNYSNIYTRDGEEGEEDE